MASCTAVSVREWGRFCVCEVRLRLLRFGRGRIRREARRRTWRSENFFSSSRVRLAPEESERRLVWDRSFLFEDKREEKEWDDGGGDKVPLLDFVKAGEERDGDENDDCFFAMANFELFGV